MKKTLFILSVLPLLALAQPSPVTKIVAGANVTISPASGVGTVTISASGGGGGGAPTDATYITQTPNGSLSAEQALSALSSGIMRVATTTGVVTSLTDSAGVAANISDETGTGVMVFSASPALTGTVAGASLSLSSLTATRVPFAATAGLLADSSAFTFNSGTGALSATSFVGSGASLTSLTAANIAVGALANGMTATTQTAADNSAKVATTAYADSAAAARGNVTASGTLTDTAIATGGGTTVVKTPSATSTLDASGNMVLAGTFSIGTNNAATVGTIELGAASDTTLARSAAGNVTVEGNYLYRAGGTAVAVADGGTGLTAGTSGGVLAYTASGTLASSAALASGNIVIGGGAGAAPLTTTTGTGVVTALGVNVGSAGAPVLFNGAGGTPSSITLTSGTGLPASGIAAGTLTANITLGENFGLIYDPALSADGTYSGTVRAGTAGATLAFGDLVYLAAADSRWELTDADSATTSGNVLIGLCVLAAASDGDPTTILLQGFIRADTAFPALTIGAPAYISTTAGDIQTAAPSTTGQIVRRVGFAWTADELYFNPSMDSGVAP